MKILYLTREDGTEYRGVKMCNSLAKLGHEVVFVGWDRAPMDKKKDLNYVAEVKLRILRRAGVFAKNSLEGWGDYYRHVMRCLSEERPAAVQAMNEEKAVLVLPFKHLLFRHLVLDVHDSVIANRYRSRSLTLAAQLCRLLGNWAADCIIETGVELQAMLGRFARKSMIIENAPFDPGPELAARVPTLGPIRLHLGGYLSRCRMGLDTLLAALDLMPPGTAEVEATGWLVDDYAREVFVKHPAVKYCWLPGPQEFLSSAAGCDALLYLRGDAKQSAYRAAVRPNRIFDALAVGRPIIVNPELGIAEWVRQDKLGYVLPRFDAASLAAVIQSLSARRATLRREAIRLRQVFLAGHTWPRMEQRLGELYCRLERLRRPSARGAEDPTPLAHAGLGGDSSVRP